MLGREGGGAGWIGGGTALRAGADAYGRISCQIIFSL